RVHVTAVDVVGSREATTELVRPENVITTGVDVESTAKPDPSPTSDDFRVDEWTEPTPPAEAVSPVQLPSDDDEILDLGHKNPAVSSGQPSSTPKPRRRRTPRPGGGRAPTSGQKATRRRRKVRPTPSPPKPADEADGEEEFWSLTE
ncbi:MAG: hypothetical protein VB859_04460, partial [Planctomycetaceae bacterium]